MGRSRKVPPTPGVELAAPPQLFVESDLARLQSRRLPLLPEGKGTILLASLNRAIDAAETAARLDQTRAADHLMKDFYQSVSVNACALLEALGYDTSTLMHEPSRRTNSWFLHLTQAVPRGEQLPLGISERSRAVIPKINRAAPRRRRWARDLSDDEQPTPEEQLDHEDRERLRQALDGLPRRLDLLRQLADFGVQRLECESRGGGRRPGVYSEVLMRRLAIGYTEAYEAKPRFDSERGDLKGPTAAWIDDVIQLAAGHAKDSLKAAAPPQDAAEHAKSGIKVAVLSQDAANRIIDLSRLSPVTLANHFKNGFAVLPKL